MHNEALKMAKHAMADACAKGYDCMTSQDWDDLKDCVETAKNAIKCDYYYRLVERMKKDEEEEKREDEYFLDMLKEEYKDEYKRMKDEYGEEDGERRFYDSWRYADGRFAPKGSGSYRPRSSGRRSRRGYTEPSYYHVAPDAIEHDLEYWRDVDRAEGRLYYTPISTNSGMNNTEGKTYSDGVNDGARRGYSDGYEKGMMDAKKNSGNSRFDIAKKGYEETKELHKGNTPEDKQLTMREADKFTTIALDELIDTLDDASPEIKNMVKTKAINRLQKI